MRALLLLGLTACNQLYGLDSTTAFADEDRDGVTDIDDDCPRDFDPLQQDADGDGRGDICDRCPLVPDAEASDLDGDGLNDACDAHADRKGDCLEVFDSFSDPATFAMHWSVESSFDMARVDTAPGSITLRYQPGFTMSIFTRELVGLYSVEVAGKSDGGQAVVVVTSGDEPGAAGYQCTLQESTGNVVSYGPNCVTSATRTVPQGVIARDFHIRVGLDVMGSTLTVFCRADYGIAIGATQSSNCTTKATGSPGISIAGTDVEIDAVAITSFVDGRTTCPTPIVR